MKKRKSAKQKRDQNKEIEEYKAKYLRALADYQNLEKRIEREKESKNNQTVKEMLLKILPILDSLERAVKESQNQGLELIIRQFQDVLASENVKKIQTVGKRFDPFNMECVEIIGGEKEEIVFEEVTSGYMIDNQLLRAAKVKVGKKN